MFPILFKLGPINIYAYGTMIAFSFLISLFLIEKEAKRLGMPYQLIRSLCFWVLILGLLGARIFYIILHLDYFKDYPAEIFKLYHGGLSLYGGIILGMLSGIIYLKNKKIPILKTLDLFAPYLALSQAVGRIGCFLNGCCFGYPSLLYGVYFPVHNRFLVPTQIYSSLLNLIIFVILRLLQPKISIKGNLFVLYLMLYSSKRFFMEFLRADSLRIYQGLTIFQIISIGVFVLSLLVFLVRTVWGNVK